jgi:hypothetical protein
MTNGISPSFSRGRKWTASFGVLLSALAVLAIVLMLNYLAARHFKRFAVASAAQTEVSPLTRRILASVTNDVQVTVYFDKEDSLYDLVWLLLKEYKFINSRIHVDVVDHDRDPSAQFVKSKYEKYLSGAGDRNLVIFDCNNRIKVVNDKELSELDVKPLVSGQSREVRRTHFKGEMQFTSAILTVTSLRALNAYFLEGHDEHRPDSDDKVTGYSEFAGVLRENNIDFKKLSLLGTNDVPLDCNLLIIAGPSDRLQSEELEKIDRYLKQGGRLFALFNFSSVNKATGLERLLAGWGVAVGNNVVIDPDNSPNNNAIVVANYGNHAITRALLESRLHLVLPRSVTKTQQNAAGPDATTVEPLLYTGPHGRAVRDVRKGALYPSVGDFEGQVPVLVAAERGRLPGVSADRGATRLIVAGDSMFLGNEMIRSLANREFASLALNWLLDRSQLLGSLGPRPIKEYKLVMTKSQMTSALWVLLLGMPGAVLLVGLLVAVRRRR